MEEDDSERESHGERRSGGVSLGIGVFQGKSELWCPVIGADVRTMALYAGDQLIVACSGSDRCKAEDPECGYLTKTSADATGCPLVELWDAFDAFLRPE